MAAGRAEELYQLWATEVYRANVRLVECSAISKFREFPHFASFPTVN